MIPAISEGRYRKELARIVRARLYGPYRRTVDTKIKYNDPQPGQRATRQVRFTKVIAETSTRSPVLPANIISDLKNETVTRMWLEGSARVTQEGIPLNSGDLLRPMAVETNRHLYQGIEVHLHRDFGCNVSMSFGKAIVEFNVNPHDRTSADLVLKTILDRVAKQLQADPIAADAISNEPFGPGELGFKRYDQPSKVLGGANYEKSAYLVETWVAGTEHPVTNLYALSEFEGVGPRA